MKKAQIDRLGGIVLSSGPRPFAGNAVGDTQGVPTVLCSIFSSNRMLACDCGQLQSLYWLDEELVSAAASAKGSESRMRWTRRAPAKSR